MSMESHNKAAEHHENAAKSHRSAAENHGRNDHDTAFEHSTRAHEHAGRAHEATNQAHERSKMSRSDAGAKGGRALSSEEHARAGSQSHKNDRGQTGFTVKAVPPSSLPRAAGLFLCMGHFC